ncbi:MAG: ParA family protein [Bacteroidota bacterium]
MLSIAICNHKGGTGKTTTVLHVAASLGQAGYRTLVIDLDPQCFLSGILGVRAVAEEDSSLVLFDHRTDVGALPVQSMQGFDLVPSTPNLTHALRRLNKPTDVLWVRELITAGLPYDVVLFDTAAALTVYSLNALVASQHVLIPVTPEYQPVEGAEQTFKTVQLVRSKLNPALHQPHFLFTQVDARKGDHREFRRYLRSRYGDLVMRRTIRTSAILAKRFGDGTTAFDHDPHARGVLDYTDATRELLTRMDAPRPAEAPSPRSPLAVPQQPGSTAA